MRQICPNQAVDSVTDLVPSQLKAAGYSLVLLDVDNTLLPWKGDDFVPEVIAWIEGLRDQGLHLCLISNTKRPERLKLLSEKLGIEYVRGKFKPSTDMYKAAMAKFNSQPSQTLMVGDQLFTDILGANRAGVDTVWVRQIHTKEFFGTRMLSRNAERLLRGRLYHAIQEEDDDLPIVPKTGILESRIVRQFAKFCIVGGSSFAIDMSLRLILMKLIPWGSERASVVFGRYLVGNFPSLFGNMERPENASVYFAAAIAGSVAILNSFYWNRRWTFGIHGKEEQAAQIRKFLVLSVCVLILNSLISGLLNNIIPGHPTRSLAIATFIATGIGAVCNFIGQRLWAFRRVRD